MNVIFWTVVDALIQTNVFLKPVLFNKEQVGGFFRYSQ